MYTCLTRKPGIVNVEGIRNRVKEESAEGKMTRTLTSGLERLRISPFVIVSTAIPRFRPT